MNYREIEWSYGYNCRFRFNFSESGRTRNDWTILHRETNSIRLYEEKRLQKHYNLRISLLLLL
jgi:hypothetical protein